MGKRTGYRGEDREATGNVGEVGKRTGDGGEDREEDRERGRG
jgi:hypothetical protein